MSNDILHHPPAIRRQVTIILINEVSSLPPGTTHLLPFGKPLRHPITHLCYRPESNIGNFPKLLGPRKRDAMQQCQNGLRPTWLTTFSPSIKRKCVTHLGVEGRHRVQFLGSCAVQHKQSFLSVCSKTSILHRTCDSLSGAT